VSKLKFTIFLISPILVTLTGCRDRGFINILEFENPGRLGIEDIKQRSGCINGNNGFDMKENSRPGKLLNA
jgi:hypothetical protein